MIEVFICKLCDARYTCENREEMYSIRHNINMRYAINTFDYCNRCVKSKIDRLIATFSESLQELTAFQVKLLSL